MVSSASSVRPLDDDPVSAKTSYTVSNSALILDSSPSLVARLRLLLSENLFTLQVENLISSAPVTLVMFTTGMKY